jgi:23S rRNA (cytidine1920-2'-O)/16S rRNA (cytidine1409-2'-O)-methyltransferase
MRKMRIDVLMAARGLVESRAQAQRLVMAGEVRVDGQLVPKPSTTVFSDAKIDIDKGQHFVSRGGIKLEAALNAFKLEVQDKTCADVGASTGGFTDCLLKHGANRVYAIDVGKGILHWKLRRNPKVVVLEGNNARYLQVLPEPVSLVTIDVSFISLKIILPVARGWLSQDEGEVVALIKPQFESGRRQAAQNRGVIRDPIVHKQVLFDVLESTQREGFGIRGLIRSPIKGSKGNIEFLGYFSYPREKDVSFNDLIIKVLDEV